MRRGRLLVSTSACALVALGALTAPAVSAAPESAADPGRAPAVSTGVSDGMIAAMRRDLGLTEEQALTRLRQEAVASRVEPEAKTAAGADYGGSWFDAERGTLVVGLTDGDRAAEVRATGAEVVTVDHTLATLHAAKATLDRTTAPKAVASWRVDPRAGGLVVSVVRDAADRADVRAFLARAESGPVPVTVEEIDARPEPYAAGTVGGDPFYINGRVRCSIGFSVHGGFVTAGHCGNAGDWVTGWDGSAMGNFVASSFPGNDYAFVRIGHGWWTVPVVLGWGTVPDRLVRGSWEAPVGSSICRSGSTTHWHCGHVLGKNETVNYAQGAVYQMTRTSVCAEPGDSGGSFITGDQAQGMTSGGWGNCSSGGVIWFQPVNEVLRAYGLALHTA